MSGDIALIYRRLKQNGAALIHGQSPTNGCVAILESVGRGALMRVAVSSCYILRTPVALPGVAPVSARGTRYWDEKTIEYMCRERFSPFSAVFVVGKASPAILYFVSIRSIYRCDREYALSCQFKLRKTTTINTVLLY